MIQSESSRIVGYFGTYAMTIEIFRAMEFAMQAHATQTRKYTGDPYWVHLAEVAGIVATVRPDPHVLITAWLHDSMEDQGVTSETIIDLFGSNVTYGVALLSDLEEGNRATRQRLSRERLANAPGWVQDIKLADIISNVSSIKLHDPKFAVLYLREKKAMVDVLTLGNTELRRVAYGMIGEI